MLPLPRREQFASVPTGIDRGLQMADKALMDTTGIHADNLGASSTEHSAVAINAKKQQGELGTFNFSDNAARAQRYCGLVLLDAIPFIYDTARITRILGEDGSTAEMLPINGHPGNEVSPIDKIYDFQTGKYDAVVDSGPSYQTKRQEASQSMTEFIRVFPQAAPIIGDLVAKNQDWPGANEIADRLKAMLPPQVQNLGKSGKLPPEAEQFINSLQNQIQQMGQEMQRLSAEASSDNKKIATEHYKIDSDNALKKYQTDMDNATKLEIARMTTGTPQHIQDLAQELLELRSRFEQTGPPEPAPALGPQPMTPETAEMPQGSPQGPTMGMP